MKSMQTAFDALKKILTSVSCLVLSNSNDEFEVTTNISKDAKAIRAELMQDDHSMIYELTKLNTYQLNYSIHDKEICAIMHALKM